ncbi:MAG: acetylglutamate kinase [Chloroflexi bacterium]|nr:acetylglutamate kinase [Chloroflexota bacterium]
MHIDVIKVGGNDLETEGFIPQLARAIAGLNGGRRCIVVHGGGRSISALMEQLGVEATFVNGQRITNEAGLRVAEMVLSGSVNKLLTLALLEAGVDAMGLSGVDRGLLRAERWAEAGSPEDMGLVGRIVEVRADVLRELCAEGVVPVISPISAGTIAGAVGARRAVFVSNVPGVKVGDEVAPRLTADEVNELIEAGVIRDGMIPKVRAALDALAKGAQSAVITNLTGLQADAGTTVVLG